MGDPLHPRRNRADCEGQRAGNRDEPVHKRCHDDEEGEGSHDHREPHQKTFGRGSG